MRPRLTIVDNEPWIPLVDGGQVHPLAPRVEEITIESIAYGCAGEPRFGGQTKPRYSVGQHCCIVYDILESWGCEPWICLWGLLHDSEEGLGFRDMPSPIKRDPRMAFYREAGDRMRAAVMRRFNLPTYEPREVKQADMVALATEQRDLIGSGLWDREMPAPLPKKLRPWSSRRAYREFLKRFRRSNDR